MEVVGMLLLAVAVPGVTLLCDAIWAYEQFDMRRAVEKTARACEGHVTSPSGFFKRPCPRRAVIFFRDKHCCLGLDCTRGQSKDHAAQRPHA